MHDPFFFFFTAERLKHTLYKNSANGVELSFSAQFAGQAKTHCGAVGLDKGVDVVTVIHPWDVLGRPTGPKCGNLFRFNKACVFLGSNCQGGKLLSNHITRGKCSTRRRARTRSPVLTHVCFRCKAKHVSVWPTFKAHTVTVTDSPLELSLNRTKRGTARI